MRVRSWMRPFVATCMPDDGLDAAVKIMKNEGYGCIVVVDEHRRPSGIVTDRDASFAALTTGLPLREIRVREAMSSPTTNCLQDDEVSQAASTMGRLRIRRLPVVNRAGFLVGILALDDIARRAAQDRDLFAPQVRSEDVARTLGEVARPRILAGEAGNGIRST